MIIWLKKYNLSLKSLMKQKQRNRNLQNNVIEFVDLQ